MKENTYQMRTYRHWIEGKDLVPFNVTVQETDLYILANTNLQRKAQRIVVKYREQLENYIKRDPGFVTALEPVPMSENAPDIVKGMVKAGQDAGVGPMAAVAGAMAEYTGHELLSFTTEVIIENGGDIYLKIKGNRIIGIYAGESPLTGKIGLEISANDTPLGVCTSSGTVGHSLSYGKADAVVVVASSAILADAAATAIGNKVTKAEDINAGIEFGQGIAGLRGIVIIAGESVGAWGDVKLCETSV